MHQKHMTYIRLCKVASELDAHVELTAGATLHHDSRDTDEEWRDLVMLTITGDLIGTLAVGIDERHAALDRAAQLLLEQLQLTA